VGQADVADKGAWAARGRSLCSVWGFGLLHLVEERAEDIGSVLEPEEHAAWVRRLTE
jgi:hypothetical protein